MSLKSRFHFWLCVWLSCVLSAMLPTAPIMLSLLVEEMRVEETDPADTSEEVADGEVTLSESKTGQRRQRREQVGVRTMLSANHRLCRGHAESENAGRKLAGQGSLWGRCGPMHC